MPKPMIERLHDELMLLEKSKAELQRRLKIEEFLDIGNGEAYLRDPNIASLVQDALLFFDEKRYRMHAWVIMPNHVHALLTPLLPNTLSEITHSWKSYTSHEVNKILGRKGHIWFPESFDRFIRNEEHYNRIIEYIHNNPPKAQLCARPEDWPRSSASYHKG